jgi:hypothetical protein
MAAIQTATIRTVPFGERKERGLLLTESPALARAFRRELRACSTCTEAFDVLPTLEEALDGGGYCWIAIDLDATIGPSEAMRQARAAWPDARLAVLSCWWSERDALARQSADAVLHKPVRSAELLAFLRPGAERIIAPAVGGAS